MRWDSRRFSQVPSRLDNRGLALLTAAFLAAAAGISVPSPVEALTHRDYPAWAVAKNASAASIISVTIGPTGKIAACTKVQEMGNRTLARQACGILARKRLRPPTLRSGEKVYAFVDSMVQFYLPDTPEGRRIMALQTPPDAEISVGKLPDGEKPDVILFLAFDSAGRVTDCAPADAKKGRRLAEIACGHRGMFDNVVKNDLSGQPVSYVTRKKVRFTGAAGTK